MDESKKIFNQNKLKSTRQSLRNNMPLPEIILWNRIRGKQLLRYKFRRQYSVQNFVIDFYCPAKKIAIEIDGDNHYTESKIVEDKIRQKKIEELGIKVLRFTNLEIETNIDGVLAHILNELNK